MQTGVTDKPHWGFGGVIGVLVLPECGPTSCFFSGTAKHYGENAEQKEPRAEKVLCTLRVNKNEKCMNSNIAFFFLTQHVEYFLLNAVAVWQVRSGGARSGRLAQGTGPATWMDESKISQSDTEKELRPNMREELQKGEEE